MPIKFPERPKREPKKAVRYQTRVTAFLDLLGFAEYVGRTRRRGDLVESLQVLLTRLSEAGQDPTWAWTRRTTSFSDSIVLSEQLAACDVADFLRTIGRLQRSMIQLELPVRGAVTVGRLFHDQSIVFGPALVEAYRFETKKAKVPRVVIAQKMIGALQQHKRAQGMIRRDADQLYFIDFLSEKVESHFVTEFNIVEQEYDTVFAMLNFWSGNPQIMQKLAWLDRYYQTYLRPDYIAFAREHRRNNLPRTVGPRPSWIKRARINQRRD